MLRRFHYIYFAIGLISVSLRQTNILWVAFVAGQSVLDPLLQTIHEDDEAREKKPVQFSLKTQGQAKELAAGLGRLLIDPIR